jgi:hypothetical protein
MGVGKSTGLDYVFFPDCFLSLLVDKFACFLHSRQLGREYLTYAGISSLLLSANLAIVYASRQKSVSWRRFIGLHSNGAKVLVFICRPRPKQ